MANGDIFSFYPDFSEFLPVYRDVTRVWIGDGANTGTMGMLYAEFASGDVVELGYITMYPIAQANGYTGSASDWAHAIIELASTSKGAVASITYCSSENGTNPPSSAEWTNTPNPVQGQYLWTKVVLTWVDHSTSTLYVVSYIGEDGPVHSVNGEVGDIILDGTNLPISGTDETSIKAYADAVKAYAESLVFVPEYATSGDIDALFEPPVNPPEEPSENPSEDPSENGSQEPTEP